MAVRSGAAATPGPQVWPGRRFMALGGSIMVIAVLMFLHLEDVTTGALSAFGLTIALTGAIRTGNGAALLFRGRGSSWALRGAAQLIAGLAIANAPTLALVTTTLVASSALIISGCLGMFLAAKFAIAPDWLVASGLVDLLTGVVLVVGWPAVLLWIPGGMLALAMLMQGAAFAAIGLHVWREGAEGPMSGHALLRRH